MTPRKTSSQPTAGRRPADSKRSILAIGGRSFVGRSLVTELRRRGHVVMVTSRRAGAGVDFVCSLDERDGLETTIRSAEPDWIVNLAGATRPTDDPHRVHDAGSRNLLAACDAAEDGTASPTPCLFVGSAAEYGAVPDAALPICETAPEKPIGAFGVSKLAQTERARAAARAGRPCLVVRPFNVLGPETPTHSLPGALALRLRQDPKGREEPFPVGNGHTTRDFVDVRDVARAMVELIEAEPPAAGTCPIYNLGTGVETSVLALAQALLDLARTGRRAVDGDAHVGRNAVLRSVADPAAIREATGWRATIDWRQSLADHWRSIAPGAAPAITSLGH